MSEQWKKFEDWLFKPGQIKRLGAMMKKDVWVKVSDGGLPPENRQVLVRVFETPYVDCFDINMIRNGQWVLSQPITHWMLPSTPTD